MITKFLTKKPFAKELNPEDLIFKEELVKIIRVIRAIQDY